MENANRAEALESLRTEALALGCAEAKLDEMERQTLEIHVKKVSSALPQKAEEPQREDLDLESYAVTDIYGNSVTEKDLECRELKAKEHTTFETQPCKRRRAAAIPALYAFEVPQNIGRMTLYNGYSMRTTSSYSKNIIDDLRKSIADFDGEEREPTKYEVAQAVKKANHFSERFLRSARDEVGRANLLVEYGFFPFLDSSEDVSQHVARKQMLKSDQVDACVAGKAVEFKCFKKLYESCVIEEEEDGSTYIFMCSAYSKKNQVAARDYYILTYKDFASNAWLKKMLNRTVNVNRPVVVPIETAHTIERVWTDSQRGEELGVFVNVKDLLPWDIFMSELRKHHNTQKTNSRQLTEVEVMKLMYPHLKTEAELKVLHPSMSIAQLRALYHNELLEPQLEKLRQEQKVSMKDEW
ncbi:MAG: hypothetical protein CLLPBCKN_002224 [Chroococcidiopsis cubana SAG 39.79]|uniref:YqaJ viral recombinase domain-containing protein n=1 Tax=Chroococcidiopsis cubana SAG 39.79 TaxID=388085 RepID=A0AB37UNA7_9CYAN|nr:hypothetical protein [Chroococcidiopsis cubana]MDZ4872828.1 hypothetical protein [Chroococcidiopsis cubana SAG 39.79]PSB66047.1 hypothetical protein C7B79_02750 [Chroococcidiopsis cubana CCALA 043]RUT12848.1 hypothetical protein DSM107010_19780 [Chroococcidiopsis cubana SAG 39.79]